MLWQQVIIYSETRTRYPFINLFFSAATEATKTHTKIAALKSLRRYVNGIDDVKETRNKILSQIKEGSKNKNLIAACYLFLTNLQNNRKITVIDFGWIESLLNFPEIKKPNKKIKPEIILAANSFLEILVKNSQSFVNYFSYNKLNNKSDNKSDDEIHKKLIAGNSMFDSYALTKTSSSVCIYYLNDKNQMHTHTLLDSDSKPRSFISPSKLNAAEILSEEHDKIVDSIKNKHNEFKPIVAHALADLLDKKEERNTPASTYPKI